MKTFNCVLAALFSILLVSCEDQAVLPATSPDISESSQNIIVRANDTKANIEIPEMQKYEIVIPQSAASWLTKDKTATRTITGNSNFPLILTPNKSGKNREAQVLLKNKDTGELIDSFTVTQSASTILPKDVLIEEIFYTGNKIASIGRPDKMHGDQYFKLTNNTRSRLDIGGLMLMEGMINSTMDMHYFDSLTVLPNYAPVQTVYCIPDALSTLEAGASIIIANNAQNHKSINTNSFDLSGADFEWYDNSSASSIQDIDNPLVPNLDIWFTYTQATWTLHDRGFQGYAIAMPPAGMTKNEFLANYKWEGQFKFYAAENSTWYTMNITGAYKVPNDWVIDAVNLGVPSVWKHNSFNSTLDAGYTSCGTIDMDPDRYGKSVIRKKVRGRLQDTNNSSDDFTPNATPSLAAN